MHWRSKVDCEDNKTYERGIIYYQDDELERFQRAQDELKEVEASYRAFDERCAHEASEEAPKASAQEDPPTPPSTLPVNTALTPIETKLEAVPVPVPQEQLQVEILPNFLTRGSEPHLKAADVAKIFALRTGVKNINGSLYFFNGKCYESPNETKFKQKSVSICSDEYRKVGNPGFIDQVYRAIILEEDFVCKEEELTNDQYIAFDNCVLDTYSKQLHGKRT